MEGLGNDCYLEVVVNQKLGGDVQPTIVWGAQVFRRSCRPRALTQRFDLLAVPFYLICRSRFFLSSTIKDGR